MADELQLMEVTTSHCGTLKVYVQGVLEDKQGKTFFITVHDMGTNHKSMVNFVNHSTMAEVKQKSVFLHVCVPGQDDNAANLSSDFTFPTLQQMGEDLVCVLEAAGVKTCIALGEGAGANIVCRFCITHPNRVMGVALLHPTSTTAGVLEYIKDKVINMRLGSGQMHQAAWEYLTFHKFGPSSRLSFLSVWEHWDQRERNPVLGQDEKKEYIKNYLEDLQQRMNAGNLSRYLDSFLKRTDLSASLADKLKMDALLVVGSRASHLHTIYTMHQAMPRDKATLLVVDGVGDVMTESPDRLSRALILFCKGCGVLSGVIIPGMERQRTLSSSMEEADRPRKMSLTSK